MFLHVTQHCHGETLECGGAEALDQSSRKEGVIVFVRCDADAGANDAHYSSEDELGSFAILARKCGDNGTSSVSGLFT